MCSGDMQPCAASRNHAVDSGAHQREQHAWREYVAHFAVRALGKPGTQPISHRHKKHGAKQAHVSDVSALQESKDFYAAHTDSRMQYRKEQHGIPFHLELPPYPVQPEHIEDRSKQQEKDQGMLLRPDKYKIKQGVLLSAIVPLLEYGAERAILQGLFGHHTILPSAAKS